MQKERIDFAIITIRMDEHKAVVDRFHPTPKRYTSGRMYGISSIQTKNGQNRTVAIARSAQQGPQSAQQVASDMIADLSPSLLLVVGIAGAVPDTDFTLGDVVVSSRIDDFGVNAYKPGEIQWDQRGGLHPVVDEIVASLPLYDEWLQGWNSESAMNMVVRPALDIAKFKDFDITRMTNDDLQNIFDGKQTKSWQRTILETLKWHFGNPPQRPDSQPLYTIGTIAASGSLIRDTSILIQWLQNARSIRAIEMESGGVFQATQKILQQYPFIAIRGISDIVGLRRDPRWTGYACQSAAAFTHALLTSNSAIFDNIRPPDQTPVVPPTTSLPDSIQLSDQTPDSHKPNDKSIQVYISYAEKDEDSKEELEIYLSTLKRQEVISTWHSRQIGLGKEKDKEVDSHIDTAQLILLLVSSRFMASNYCYEQEMTRALQRQASNDVRIIPILLRPTDLEKTPFSKLQGLPRNGKPISSWRSSDDAWYEVAKEIRAVCNDLLKAKMQTKN